jgi:hypothetical protein
VSRSGSTTIHIDAPPDAVYALVSDITRMGEWSPETVKAEWIEGATGPAAGARFKGTNKLGFLRWSTKPMVEVADPGREFTFVTMFRSEKETRWSYRLAPAGDGTDVTESWEELSQIPIIGRLMMNDRRERQLTEGCAKTLARIKAAAEA